MAGRYVILEFEDANAAKVFVSNSKLPEKLGYKLTAMFIKPVAFCDCPDKRRQNAQNWRKGKRTGLYLCIVCKKPSVHHQQGILSRLQYVFGFNLLEGDDG